MVISNSLLQKIITLISQYFKLFGLYFLFGIFLIVFRNNFPNLDFDQYNQDGILELFSKNKLHAFFSLVVMAPLLEEGIFRTLIKPKSYEIPLFLSSVTVLLLSFTVQLEIPWYYRFSAILACITIGSIVYAKLLPKKLIVITRVFLYKHHIITLQITSIIFGLIHILNYVDSFQINVVLFLLIVPRIFAGHMCGVIKLKNDHLIWSILLHAINNGVVFFSLLFLKQ